MINKHSVISDPGALNIVHQADAALKDIQSELVRIDRSHERFKALEKRKHQQQIQAKTAAMYTTQSPDRGAAAHFGTSSHRKGSPLHKWKSDLMDTATTTSAARPPIIADILDDFDRRSKLPVPSEFPFDKVDKELRPMAEKRAIDLQLVMSISDSMSVRRLIRVTRRKATAAETNLKNSLRDLVATKLELQAGSCSMQALYDESGAFSHDASPQVQGVSSRTCSSPTSPLMENRMFPSEVECNSDSPPSSSDDGGNGDADEDDSELIKQFLRFASSTDGLASTRHSDKIGSSFFDS